MGFLLPLIIGFAVCEFRKRGLTVEINVLLVDDDKQALDLLKQHLQSFSFIKIVGEVHSGEEAIRFLLENESIDLLMLDIEMGGITGLEVANHIQSTHPNISVIFTTGHAGFALEGYKSHPVDFLTKPIDIIRLEQALNKVKELKTPTQPKITNQKIGLKVSKGIQIIDVGDILYIEKKGRTISIVSKNNESIRSSDTMQNLENIFAPYEFYRSHQSFLVPINQIKAIYPDDFSRSYTIDLMDNQTKIPLSRNRYPDLKTMLEKRGIHIY